MPGPTIADFKSWNVGVRAGPNAVPNSQRYITSADFALYAAGQEMFCDGCDAGGSRYGFYAYGGTVHLANSFGNVRTEAGGVIDAARTPPM